MRPPLRLTTAGVFLVLIVFAAAAAVRWNEEKAHQAGAVEIAAAIRDAKTESEQITLLAKLIQFAGPEAAQELLGASGLTFSVAAHTLTHEIGHSLYQKFGPAAISRCKDYFYFGCYHGVVHYAFSDNDPEVLEAVFVECHARGPNIAGRCSHGLGHSLLAEDGYDVLAALRACDAAVNEFSVNLEGCTKGVFMENGLGLFGGEEARKRWLRQSDPSFPCTDPRIPERHRAACWEMQPYAMAEIFNGNVKRVAEGCMEAPTETMRASCFKFFTGWVLYPQARDSVDSIFALCKTASPPGWYVACLSNTASQAFEAGDRARIPFKICAQSAGEEKEPCYKNLFDTVRALYPRTAERNHFCGSIRETEWRSWCLTGGSEDGEE